MKQLKFILSLKSLWSLKSLSCFIIALVAITSNATTPDSLFQKGNEYYIQKQYAMAEKYYSTIISMGYESAELYFNLGNSLYKQEKLAPAILYYEKALVIKPGDEEVKENLALANARIIDKIDAIPEFFVKRWFDALRGLFSPDTWAIISISLFIAGLGVILISYFISHMVIKNSAFLGGLGLVVLALISIIFMATRIHNIKKHEHAIIMSTSVTARSSPDEQSTNVFVLHEGTKVQVTDSIQTWKEIRIANGNTGWIPGEAVEEI